MGKLDGKVCIITGTASGLGKQEAIRFADEGARLAICSRTVAKLEETKRLCEEKGAEVLACPCDVTVAEQREAFIDAVIERYETIDVLVNNAHTTTPLLPFLAKTLDELELETKCCIYAYFHFMQLCAPHMMDKPGAGTSIINFSSKAAREGTVGHAVYATVKAAVGGLTRVTARELGPLNIRVNSIMPGGFTDNCAEGLQEQSEEIQKWAEEAFKDNPFERVGDPYADVTPILLFLASDESHWMTGQNLHADGGAFISD
ncbi:MAG: SDR family oxidoreductase [Coriobacteriales bacterium]|jgi:NAD(P)-dependent dehydrogenase (short-subunit alcohol dehydrogenase family)|nr:SDR family oxidoreductase [Coriobacteriales bacterium]